MSWALLQIYNPWQSTIHKEWQKLTQKVLYFDNCFLKHFSQLMRTNKRCANSQIMALDYIRLHRFDITWTHMNTARNYTQRLLTLILEDIRSIIIVCRASVDVTVVLCLCRGKADDWRVSIV